MYKNKILLITGVLAGNAILKKFLNTDIEEVRIFLEMKKQDDMRRFYKNDKIKFI